MAPNYYGNYVSCAQLYFSLFLPASLPGYFSPSRSPPPSPSLGSSQARTATAVGVSVAISLVVLLALLVTLLVLLLYCKKHDHINPTPDPRPEEANYYPIPNSGYVQIPLPDSAPVVLVLYSLRTSYQQQEKIHSLLSGLAGYGLMVETPGTIGPRDISREWLEVGMKQAKAVLLVCNDQFYEEWTDKCASESDCKLQIGREVRVLKNGLKDIELRKFAYIYCEHTDKDYSMLSSYIQTSFTLAGDIDTIHSIAQFVQNVPEFEL